MGNRNRFFSARRRQRIRDGMLLGVFEENLRINGLIRKEKNKRIRAWIIVKTAVFLIAIFSYTQMTLVTSESLTPFSRKSVLIPAPSTAPVLENSPAQPVSQPRVDFSEYSFLTDQTFFALRDLFGLQVRTIVIDPGHGGGDPGALGRMGTREKDITLDIAQRLKRRFLGHLGYQVLLTREADLTLSLEERVRFANQQQTDLFISLHVNFIPGKSYGIIETYYFGPNSDRRTLALAQRENQGTHYSMNDFRSVLQNISNTLKLQESRLLARKIQNSLYRNIHLQNGDMYNYGVKTAPFVVLIGVEMPSILAELSCLSNLEEERKLSIEAYREEIAGYLEQGIRDYIDDKRKQTTSEV